MWGARGEEEVAQSMWGARGEEVVPRERGEGGGGGAAWAGRACLQLVEVEHRCRGVEVCRAMLQAAYDPLEGVGLSAATVDDGADLLVGGWATSATRTKAALRSEFEHREHV